jgi:hypothetical protein
MKLIDAMRQKFGDSAVFGKEKEVITSMLTNLIGN